MLFSKFDKIALVIAVLLLGTILVSAATALNTSKPTHQLSQVGVNSTSISDNNIITAAYGGTGVNGCTGDGNILYWNNTTKKWVCGSNVNISGTPTGAALSGGIANTITKWITSTTIGNSIITDDGATITLGGAKGIAKLVLDSNTLLKVGGTMINGIILGNNYYAHFSNNAWYNGNPSTGWTGTAPGALIQLANQSIAFFTTDATGTPTPTVTISSTGILSATKGLVIETRTTDPASPVTGQMWLITS